MRFRPEVKVGLIVFLALIALIVVYGFFGGLAIRRGTYNVCAVFNDALRLQRQGEVRMAGVLIGRVHDIGLTPDNRAKVELLISRQYLGDIPSDSTARITTGGVVGVGDYYVEIIPGSSGKALEPGECMASSEMPRLDDMLGQVQNIVTGLEKSVSSINEVLQDPQTRRSMRNILANVEQTTELSTALVQDLRQVVAVNQDEVSRTLANVESASRDFAALSREMRIALQDADIGRIEQIVGNAVSASENLAAASGRLRTLAEDPEIEAQIRTTIKSASEAAEGASRIVERLSDVLGRTRRLRRGEAGAVPDYGSRLDLYARTGNANLRLDYNLTFPGGADRFYRLGLRDIGEDTGLNLQLGHQLDSRSAFRYGLFASRLGVGYDRQLANDLNLHFDLYHPNDPKLEAKFRYDFSPNLGAWIGIEDVFEGRGGLFGLQYRR